MGYFKIIAGTLFTGISNIVSERNSLKFYDYIKQRKYNLAYGCHYHSSRTVQLQSI